MLSAGARRLTLWLKMSMELDTNAFFFFDVVGNVVRRLPATTWRRLHNIRHSGVGNSSRRGLKDEFNYSSMTERNGHPRYDRLSVRNLRTDRLPTYLGIPR